VAGPVPWRRRPALYREHALFVTDAADQAREQLACGARVIMIGGEPVGGTVLPAGDRWDLPALRDGLAALRTCPPLSPAETLPVLRDIFAAHDLQAFAKTSGSKGMQLYVPLNIEVDYETTKTAALGLAQRLEREHPDQVLHMMERAQREGKVFIDWSQNDQHKTTVNVYSLRARPRPTVSTPVMWEEVEACWQGKDASLLTFEATQVLDRVDRHGDLFAPLRELEQRLPSSLLEGVEPPTVDPAQRKASWARRREIEKERAAKETS